MPWIRQLLIYFPGVPVFFFVSGFLISRSYERSDSLKQYTINRLLRIYPALLMCLVFSALALISLNYIGLDQLLSIDGIVWLAAQSTFFQFYNPDFLRDFGVGVLNGSLWTISVELQFYILMPLLFLNRTLNSSSKALITLIFIFIFFNQAYTYLRPVQELVYLFKLWQVTFVPWLYMFLLGVLFQRNFDHAHSFLAGKGIVLVPIYIGFAYISDVYLGLPKGNNISPLLFLFLAFVVFSLAYTLPRVSILLLRRNDISYGIYVYHMPVVNIAIYLGYAGNTLTWWVVIGVTIVLACLSWKIIEYPALRLKPQSIRGQNTTSLSSDLQSRQQK